MNAMSRTQHSRKPALGLASFALSATVLLSGCSIPGLPGPTGAPVAERAVSVVDTSETPDASAETQVVPAPAADSSRSVAWVRTPADLDRGSVTHTLSAATHQIGLDYWTTEDPSSWTPESTPIINLNAHILGEHPPGTVRVTRFTARNEDGSVIMANDEGSFAMEPPYAYTSAIVVPAEPGAHATRVLLTFDLLSETAKDSGVFSRQTIMDSISIGYAKPGPVETPAAAAAP